MADNYENIGKETYGTACEWIGCGWNVGTCDVHHIDYQDQQATEVKLRKAYAAGDTELLEVLNTYAEAHGWGTYDAKTRQLEKNSVASNLTVLCPNHHRYLHGIDLGMDVLKYIPGRK